MTKELKKGSDLVELTNGQIRAIKFDRAINEIINATGWKSADKFRMLKLLRSITESPEAKAVDDHIDQIRKRYMMAQKGLPPEERMAQLNDDPELLDLLKLDSGLSIEKLKIKVKVIPEDVSAGALLAASWLINIDLDIKK